MSLTVSSFRRLCPTLEHYAVSGMLLIEAGLMTAAQLLDANADRDGIVWAKFQGEPEYRPYRVAYWQTHARFKRGAGERGCNVLVRDSRDPRRSFFLAITIRSGTGDTLGPRAR